MEKVGGKKFAREYDIKSHAKTNTRIINKYRFNIKSVLAKK